MDLSAFPPIAALLDGAHAVLMGLADLLEPLVGVSSAAAAVVLVTLLLRAALIPVGVAQAKAERTRARLAPRLAALQRKHQKDPGLLQHETMSLYRSEGTTPLAGCVPMLIQAPVVGIIYALFVLPAIAGHPNDLLTHTLFGVPLGSSLAGSVASAAVTPDVLLVFGVVIVMIAAIGEVTRRVFRPATTNSPTIVEGPGAGTSGSPLENPAALRLLGLLQFITAAIAVFVPLAAGLYLLVTVAWTLAQRMLLRRVYPWPAPSSA